MGTIKVSDSEYFLNHQILVGTGTTIIGQLPLGSSGQLLLSGGARADPTWNSSGDAGQILLSGGASTSPSWNTSGTLNQVLHSGGGRNASNLERYWPYWCNN